MSTINARSSRIFAPEMHALCAKFIAAFESSGDAKVHQLKLTPRESMIFRACPEVFEDLVRDMGGAMRRRDSRPYPRSPFGETQQCADDHTLHAVWTWSLWKPWQKVHGLACWECDMFVVEPD